MTNCNGKTKSGRKCKNKAKKDGLCSIHATKTPKLIFRDGRWWTPEAWEKEEYLKFRGRWTFVRGDYE